MRKHILVIFLNILTHGLFCSNVITLPVRTSDIVYSPGRDKLYAIVDAMDVEFGNRLLEINAGTGAVERSLFVGSEPLRLRLTTDEEYIWISFIETPFMKRVELGSFTIDKSLYLGPSIQSNTPHEKNTFVICYNFTVFPDENNMLAMGLQTEFTFDYEGIVLYRDDAIQPVRIIPSYSGSSVPSCMEPVLDNNYLIGYKQTSSYSKFIAMAVLDDGLEKLDEFDGLIGLTGTTRRNFIKVHDDSLFVAEGYIIDATDISDLQVVGKCENDVIGDLYGFTFSEIHNAYIYPNMHSDSLFLTYYDRNTFTAFEEDFVMIYPYNETVLITKLEVIGENKFALRIGRDFGDFSTLIIDTKGTGISENKGTIPVRVYPNPVADEITIEGYPLDKAISISDPAGRTVKTFETRGYHSTLFLGKMKPGLYILEITDSNTSKVMSIRKIIIQ